MSTPSDGQPQVIAITAEQAHNLRYRVLRVGTPSSVVEYVEDEYPTTRHLGIELRGQIVAITTWIDQPSPDAADRVGVQLRGMATDPGAHVRGRGLGSLLLRSGIVMATDDGADVVWANARDSAMDFYRSHGFQISSDAFMTSDTALPHHRILLNLH